jgi:hypothetical protein
MDFLVFDPHQYDPEGMSEVDLRVVFKWYPVLDDICHQGADCLPEGLHLIKGGP